MRILLKSTFIISLVGIYLCFPFFLSKNNIDEPLDIVITPPAEQIILESMSIEEKVGQLFMFGFYGPTVNENIASHITDRHIGGILLLGYNIENENQLKGLISQLQDLSSIPLLVSIDQEGGIVSRLKGNIILTKAPKDIKDEEEAYCVAVQRGEMLKELGINMNLAPVVEYITDKDSFMYKRVYRGTKEEVAMKSSASIKGYKEKDIIPVAKHYPGHSNLSPDSHYLLPKINIEDHEWDEYIFPFRTLTSENVIDVIMVGHILFPNIDTLPSTISSEILNKRLRENLEYDGIVITDDMEMDSIESVGEYTDIAKQALLAGNDILMYSGIPQVQKDVYEYILQSVSNGEITEGDIDKKVLRILKVKIKYGILNIESIQQFQE